MGNLKHSDQDKIAKYINWKYTPKDIKLSRMIISKQLNKEGEATVYLRLRRYDPLRQKDIIQRKMDTGVKVKPKFWSTKKGEVLRGDFDYQKKNRIIQEKESQVSNYIHNPDLTYKMAQLRQEEFLIIEQVFPSERLLKLNARLQLKQLVVRLLILNLDSVGLISRAKLVCSILPMSIRIQAFAALKSILRLPDRSPRYH